MEFDEQLTLEPDFISCSVKSEPQDVPYQEESIESTWEPSPPVIKSEPKEEEVKDEEPEEIRGSSFHVYLPSVTEKSEFLEEDSKHLDASDNIAQFCTVELKNNEGVSVKVEPEDVKKSELTVEDEGPASDTERLSLDYTEANLELSSRRVFRKSSNSEDCATFSDSSNVFDNECEHAINTQTNTKGKSYICSTCNKTFTRKKALRRHSIVDHGEKTYACLTCNKSFGRKEVVTRHSRLHSGEKPFVCQTCNRSFAELRYLKSHLKIHSVENPFKCSMCNKSFSQKAYLRKHLRTHSGEKPHVCSTCKKSFADKVVLTRHLRIHTGEKPFVCSTCNKSFARREVLRRHSIIHREVKHFLCPT